MTDTNENAVQKLWPDGEGPLRRETVADSESALIVDVGGFEGPLDLLLELARHHKVDLAQISILALAEQYLAYIDNARKMRIEVAADYLVMAAWLAYLKSRMLIPMPPGSEDEPATDLAAQLAFRLQRLQAMRDAAAKLTGRNILGRDVFGRGNPEPLIVETQREYADKLIDLLKAYAERRQRKASHQTYTLKRHATWSIKEAREALERLVGTMDDWSTFDHWLEEYLGPPDMRRTVRASSFTASLELVREGLIELRQDDAFRPIFMRRRA
jgi:segregation and condensation protein A